MCTTRLLFIPLLILLFGTPAAGQNAFYYGQDLSFVNQMEDCGAEYKRDFDPVDPYALFADLGTNLVRVRLWVDPSWWQEPLNQPDGVRPWYSDFEDVKLTIQRAKDQGMKVLLNFHYSDFWADPGNQLIPRSWLEAANDPEALADSVYNYTLATLNELEAEGLMPELVQVGNETNPGVLVHIPVEDGFGVAETVAEFDDWQRHALIYNAGIQAVRDAGAQSDIQPQIALHWSGISGIDWWIENLTQNGVSDFDIIGFSYYYAWHGESIGTMKSVVESLRSDFPEYDVMALETAYLWSQDYGEIINEPDPQYLPVSPETQLDYMVDYTRAVKSAGGIGVIFWEPAWVDTPCVTPWETGSSHTHVAFFDPYETNFIENGGGNWTNFEFYEDLVSIPENSDEVPAKIALHQNYPNPFNPSTMISYSLDAATDVRLTIYTVQGQTIRTLIKSHQPAGTHQVSFDATGLAGGLYLYQLKTPETSITRKMMLIK